MKKVWLLILSTLLIDLVQAKPIATTVHTESSAALIAISGILLLVVVVVLYRRQKRRFND